MYTSSQECLREPPSAPKRDASTSSPGAVFTHRPAESFAAGRVVCWEGDPSRDAFQLVEGSVRFCRVQIDGHRMIAGFGFAGDVFGLSYMERYIFSAEAITDCRVRRLSYARLTALSDNSSADYAQITEQLRQQLHEMQNQLLLMLHKSADERVAYFIMRVGQRLNRELRNGSEIRLAMPRTDIADHLGLTVETVCRSITRLKRDGVLALNGPARMTIKDIDAMRRRCGDETVHGADDHPGLPAAARRAG